MSDTPDVIQPDQVLGLWLLESVTVRRADGGLDLPFGPHPQGTIIYLSGGTMAVHIAGSGLAAHRLRAYAGAWRLAGGIMVHEVEASIEPELCGVRLERQATWDGGRLVYRTCEAQGAGHPEVIWRRP
jgi:hypothetical protein